MPVDKFRFVSPGIFLNEIDQSQIPALPENVGPVIVGRTEKGPGMIPTKVRSFSEFVEIFGNPIAGLGGVTDVWREGNYSSPTYGAYAAQAYLRSGVGPVTFIRLVGTQHPDATTAGYAGWQTANDPSKHLGQMVDRLACLLFHRHPLASRWSASLLSGHTLVLSLLFGI